jgi:hypothetical protein
MLGGARARSEASTRTVSRRDTLGATTEWSGSVASVEQIDFRSGERRPNDGLCRIRFKSRGRNYTWTTAFTVPIEVRVA